MSVSPHDPIEVTRMRIRCLKTAWEMSAAEESKDTDAARVRYEKEVAKLANLEAAERGRSAKAKVQHRKERIEAMKAAKMAAEDAYEDAHKRAETLQAAAKTMAHEWQEYLSAVSRATAALSPFPTSVKATVSESVPAPRSVAKLIGRELQRAGLDSRILAVLPGADSGHTAAGYVQGCAEKVSLTLAQAINQAENPES